MKTLSFLLCVSAVFAAGCGSSGTPTSASSTTNVPYSQTDLVVGTGRQAAAGNRVTVNYTGWLYDPVVTDNKGRVFDSGTFTFVLGAGQVIRGFDQGVAGIAVGGKRRLVIPPSLGYGSAGAPNGGIPANATLIFEVEAVNVTD